MEDDIEVLSTLAVACTALLPMILKENELLMAQHSCLPLLGLTLRRMDEGKLYCFSVAKDSLIDLAESEVSLKFLREAFAGLRKLAHIVNVKKKVYFQPRLKGFLENLFTDQTTHKSLIEDDYMVGLCLPQARNLLAALAHLALPEDQAGFFLVCLVIHKGTQLVVCQKSHRDKVATRGCSWNELFLSCHSLLESFSTGPAHTRLTSILQGQSIREFLHMVKDRADRRSLVLLKQQHRFLRISATEQKLTLNLKRLLKETLEPEKSVTRPCLSFHHLQHPESLRQLTKTLAKDIHARGEESLCVQYNGVAALAIADQELSEKRLAGPPTWLMPRANGEADVAKVEGGPLMVFIPPKSHPILADLQADPLVTAGSEQIISAATAAAGLADGSLVLHIGEDNQLLLYRKELTNDSGEEVEEEQLPSNSDGDQETDMPVAPSVSRPCSLPVLYGWGGAAAALPIGLPPWLQQLPQPADGFRVLQTSEPQEAAHTSAHGGLMEPNTDGMIDPAARARASAKADDSHPPLATISRGQGSEDMAIEIPLPPPPLPSSAAPPVFQLAAAPQLPLPPLGPAPPIALPNQAPRPQFSAAPELHQSVMSETPWRTYCSPGVQMELAFFDYEPRFRPWLNMAQDQDSRKHDPLVEEDGELSMLEVLPQSIRVAVTDSLEKRKKAAEESGMTDTAFKHHMCLVELALDVGRPVVLQFLDGTQERVPINANVRGTLKLADSIVRAAEMDDREENPNFMEDVDKLFTQDNRLGLPATLHRISALRNRANIIVGLTCRIGRHIHGEANLLLDLLHRAAKSKNAGHNASILLVGPPGVGKTTLLRDLVHILANRLGLGAKVMVVDTSNEIGGFGDPPHPAIGDARRLSVRERSNQHKELVEAVQNHNPSVVVVDEIGNLKEAEAMKAIAHRGAVVIGTAHGNNLNDLMKNPDLVLLVGGLTEVTIGDMAAKRQGNRKTKAERQGEPVFQSLVEVIGFDKLRVHMDIAANVDTILENGVPVTQVRQLLNGRMAITCSGGAFVPNLVGAMPPPQGMSFNPSMHALNPPWGAARMPGPAYGYPMEHTRGLGLTPDPFAGSVPMGLMRARQ